MRVEHKIPVPHLVLRLNIQLYPALEYTNNQVLEYTMANKIQF